MVKSEAVGVILGAGWEAKFGGKLEFEPDMGRIVEKSLAHIDKKRAALNLPGYDAGRFGQSGDGRIRSRYS
ncbi:MAG: hypothetical protein A2Z04_09940 [Chloroflexi bacterium RBG_16_57_9]|nr:MAG: hypothetical protein A2Z04_09940 [Chloroflexi bacterium RBG_16_57_9]